MTNHPNRGPKGPVFPAPDEIFGCRFNARLTKTECADLVHVALRTWQQWEAGDRRMPLAAWELFCIKLGIPPNIPSSS